MQQALEERHSERVIGASLEAKVTLTSSGETFDLLAAYEDQLPSIFIVSAVSLNRADSGELQVKVEHADGAKCERCWNWSETVGEDARCVRQVEEGRGASGTQARLVLHGAKHYCPCIC